MRSINLIHRLILLATLGCTLAGCKNTAVNQNPPEIAVTNSYLHCVVNDLCENKKQVFCLTPPGMCPGHFDISPDQVNKLCGCRLLLRFDFQKGIDDSLSRMKEKGLKICSVPALPGLCVPETYLAACRDVCKILSFEYPERKAEYNRRLKQIEARMENLTNELYANIKQTDIESAKVLASHHQSKFCNWLGLETIAEFAGSDVETAANINNCLQKARDTTIRFVIANKQEGTALAHALAEQLGAKTVVFSNFPDSTDDRNGFDGLLRGNVRALLKAETQ